MPETSSLIVTLLIDADSFLFFNQLRQKYFPPDRNFLNAHLTLFHNLPSNQPQIRHDLISWSEATQPFALSIVEIKNIGKGVAHKMESPYLLKLHAQMQVKWKQWLTPQDQQKIWPHITIQNKVAPATAKETLIALQKGFKPFKVQAEGLMLWHYQNGPWKFIEEFKFIEKHKN